ncbi:FAD-binding domain-containing protein [Sodiomyces alkalinus F11]|uniref:FAD-binding domain-containing protein n=1 Tax=Sodiomyces alkalinus (strain CBS 110278 / VKM F-3762 / F11) TaxID=1314773 RepID=A0A3N2PLK0_SODAK|nr:FAD-binding domain-containing protein [Sodiomyces alkalinus F11]ROT35392.1 FAD-binding domain-containing protein [Sodiomyces alkalinus F11]
MTPASTWMRVSALAPLAGLIVCPIAAATGPAADKLSAGSSFAPAELFEAETIQLTDESLASLAGSFDNLEIFDFADGKIAKRDEDAEEELDCKVFPGDPEWPSEATWDLFNILIDGALRKPLPLASVCYDGAWGPVDQAECERVASQWQTSQLHFEHPTSVMSPLLAGNTCPPTGNANNICTIGGLPVYAVEATDVMQIQLAVNLARNMNLRLVVKNTGHDFGGKSAGAGALSVWTHRLKDIQFYPDYRTSCYQGPAFKMGSGVQSREVYEAADEHDVIVMGGEGRTVGAMGGWTMGGGHSPFSSLWGMGADQVLSMEIVTPDGRFVTASRESNPDLFWALCGGGGGTWGVVTSVVVKAHPQPEKMASMRFTVATGGAVTVDAFWAAMRLYFKQLPDFTDKGFYHYFFLFNFGGSYLFMMGPWFAPTMGRDELLAETKPLFDAWAELGVVVVPEVQEYTGFLRFWEENLGSETAGNPNTLTASRLFPRENFLDEAKFNRTWDDALRWSVEEKGRHLLGFTIAGQPPHGRHPNNSVNPAWRSAALHAITAAAWDDGATAEERSQAAWELTNVITERWREVTPGAGAYMSEADPSEPNFQQSFYGDKYDRLFEIKKAYDPHGVFYAHTGVGSEEWFVTGQDPNIPTQNGRLCRKR